MTTTKTRELTDLELAHLRTAGRWGLLRGLGNRLVCATGTTSLKREHLAVLVEAAGGRFTNSMSGSVDVLVVADEAPPTSKQDAARKAGTEVLRESDFAMRLLPTPAELLAGETDDWADAVREDY